MMRAYKYIVYFRVSTDRQGRSGLGLDAQRNAVSTFLSNSNAEIVTEIIEIESGTNNHRPHIAETLRLCRVHNAILLIAKLDRLARNVAFISGLMESGVEFVAVDFPTANRLTIHILAAVAEHEAKLISDRTKAALTAARARGTRLGGDRGNLPSVAKAGARQSALVRSAKAAQFTRDVGPLIRKLSHQGLSLRKIAQELTSQSIRSPRGGAWSATSVQRVLAAFVG